MWGKSKQEGQTAVAYARGTGTPAERTRPVSEPLHAYEITPADATLTLPSGKTITGTEMQRWLDANKDED